MLKIISCKNDGEVYKIIHQERGKEFGIVQECELDEAVTLGENVSIFGDKNSFLLKIRIGNRNVVNEEDGKYINEKFFSSLQNSEHFFSAQIGPFKTLKFVGMLGDQMMSFRTQNFFRKARDH